VKNIYLASRFSRRDELVGNARDLQDRGFRVTSRWLTDPSHVASVAPECDDLGRNNRPFNHRLATEDLVDVRAADTLIYFSPGGSRGGCHVEFGVALERNMRLIVIGQRDHVFSWLAGVEQYDTWAMLLAHIDDDEVRGGHRFFNAEEPCYR